MSVEQEILKQQLAHNIFENATFQGTEGIAKRAVAEGFSTLSDRQQAVLAPYLTQTCSGVTDPGGHHNECSNVLEEEELLAAYQRSSDSDSLICEKCENEEGFYDHQWAKIAQE